MPDGDWISSVWLSFAVPNKPVTVSNNVASEHTVICKVLSEWQNSATRPAKKKKIWHKYKVRFNSNKYFPSLWWAGDNRLNVWLTEEGPSYGLNSFTALWITWESERLREITLTENPGKQGESNHIWEGQPRKKTRSNCV